MSIAASTKRKLPAAPAAPKWRHQKYGTLTDPVHKSHMGTLIGEYSCTEQFRRDRLRELTGAERDRAYGKTEMGTAGHETIRRALSKPEVRDRILAGRADMHESVIRAVVREEFLRAVGGREVYWHKTTEKDVEDDIVAMVAGLFADLHRHVAEVVLCESGWIARVGDYYTEGHIDLVYRPRSNPEGLAITDWKTGEKPHQIELDHGFESGLYSNALERGTFLPVEVLRAWRTGAAVDVEVVPLPVEAVERLRAAKTERDAMHVALRALAAMAEAGEELPPGPVRFGAFPDEIWLTSMPDFVPYARAGKKRIERPEDVDFWSEQTGVQLSPGSEVKYTAGQRRGPAWYRVRRTAGDVLRLHTRLRTIVGWVRMGLFVDSVGEKCTRCSYRVDCLTSGYQRTGDEAKELGELFKGAGDGFDGMEP